MNSRTAAVLLVIGLLCAAQARGAQPTQPQVLYVNRTDSSCGGHSPCYTTIQAAINAAQPRATIRIQPGTYPEQLKIQKNDFPGAVEADRIVIEADPLLPPGKVVLTGTAGNCGDRFALRFTKSQFITVRGLTITGTGAQAISVQDGNEGIHIERNRIFGNGNANCNGGITIGKDNHGTLIVNNLIYGNGRSGIAFSDADGGPHFIVNNTIFGNQWNGLDIAGQQIITVANNIINGNGTIAGSAGGRFGIQRQTRNSLALTLWLVNNLICGNTGGQISGNALDPTDSGNFTPLGNEGPGVAAKPGCEVPANIFVGPKGRDGITNTADDDFQLSANSLAIDIGIDPRIPFLGYAFNAIFEADFSQNDIRPADGNADRFVAFDAGAFEYPNAPPVANAGSNQNAQRGQLVTLNGTLSRDPEGAPLTYQWTILSQPGASNITLTGATTARPSFTPQIFGSYAFQLVVNDGQFNSAPSTAAVSVVNVGPKANDLSVTTNEDVPAIVTLTATDIDAASLTFAVVSGPSHGTLTVTAGTMACTRGNCSAALTYTPAPNYNGPDSFTFNANDGIATSNTAAISITVNPVNDAPVANNVAAATDEEAPVTIILRASDIDSHTLTFTIVSGPSHGIVVPTNGPMTCAANGTCTAIVTYTPAANFNSLDSFSFSVTDGQLLSNIATASIVVNNVNDAPFANDISVSTIEDNALLITLGAGDIDSASLNVMLLTRPTHGSLGPVSSPACTIIPNGEGVAGSSCIARVTYTPAADYNGPDNFTYNANDGSLNSNTASVSITVQSVNDAPAASDDFYTIDEDTPLSLASPGVLGNDNDVDTAAANLTALLVRGPQHAASFMLNADGSFAYTPDVNFNGTDTFIYKVNDGAVDSNEATVTIAVSPVNDAPVAANDAFNTDEDTTLDVPGRGVLANDNDIDTPQPNLTAIVVAGPSHATAFTLNPDGSFSYTPAANFNGVDSFTYKANDGARDSNIAMVSIAVLAINDTPVAENDNYNMAEDTALSIPAPGVLENDSDADTGQTLTAEIVSAPAHAISFNLDPNGSFSYTPETNFNGVDTFMYRIFDGTSYSNVAMVQITVTNVNDAPLAQPQAVSTNQNTPVIITLSAGDIDSKILTFNIAVAAGHGTLGAISEPACTIQGQGAICMATVTYTPAANYFGSDNFTFTASDGQASSAPAAVSVSVIQVNHSPTANVGGPYTGIVGVPIQFSGSGNDPDGNPITFSWSFGDGDTGSGPAPSHTYTAAGNYSVILNVTDTFNASGSSQTTATISPALALNPIGNRTVNLGETLSFTVNATGPSAINLHVTPLPLMINASFNAGTGVFSFRPDTTQVGAYQLTFTATAGTQSASETITITVPQPPPGGTTGVQGRVVNLAQTPLSNVRVTLKSSGHTAFSGPDGSFRISGIPSGAQQLIVNGRGANLGVYAILAVAVNLIDGVMNNLGSAITLPDVDVDAEVQVDPNNTTVITNPNVPGVVLTIAAGTAKNSDGTPFTGKLSINPVPDYGRPESRPEELRPGMAITIQPAGVRFNPPAQLVFPNADNMASGNELNLWSLSPDTGTFNMVGKGVVSGDGRSFVTTEGGVSASAWHFFLAPSGSSNTDVNEADGLVQDPRKQCKGQAGSTVALQNGCVGVEFSLPAYRSLGTPRALTFIYQSNRANPQPLIPFNATISSRAAVPPTLSYSLSVGGAEQSAETFINTSGLNEDRDETIRGTASFDASQLATGVYPYRIKLTSNYLNSAIASFISDKVLVINEQKSPFGAGWSIGGLGRLFFQSDGSALFTDGDGTAIVFARDTLGPASWWAASGNADDKVGINHGVLQNGTTFTGGQFGQAFSFDGVDDYVQLLNSITNPFPAAGFTYAFWVNPADTPAGRSRTIASNHITSGNWWNGISLVNGQMELLLQNSSTGQSFTWTTTNTLSPNSWQHVAVVYKNQGNQSTDALIYINGSPAAVTASGSGYTSGFSPGYTASDGLGLVLGRLVEDTPRAYFKGLMDEVQFYTRTLSAAEVQAIINTPGKLVQSGNFTTPAGDFSTLAANSDGTLTRTFNDGTKVNFNAQGLQASVVDRNGNTMTYAYNGSGRLSSLTDPAGLVTTLSYGGNLLSSITDPAGRVTAFQYDGAGNLSRVTFPDGSSRFFGYDSKHRMTSETDQRGFTVQRQYDSAGRLVSAAFPDGSSRSAKSAQTVGFVDASTGLGSISNPAPVVRPTDALATYTDGNGNPQTVKVGKFGAPQQITDAQGQTTTIDRSGNDGRLQNGASFAAGRVGQAFSLDGIDDFVTMGDVLDVAAGSFTVEAWVNTNVLDGNFHHIISKGQATYPNYQLMIGSNNRFRFSAETRPGETDDAFATSTVSTSTWYHVAGVRDTAACKLRIYVNGSLEGEITLTTCAGDLSNSDSFQVGQGSSDFFWNGLIDEVGVYSRSLSSAEIAALFSAGNIGNRATPPPGLLSRWEAEGNANDAAGNGGLPSRIVASNGAVTSMTYDLKGNLLTSTAPTGATTTFTYEPTFNQVKTIRDSKTNTTTINYDSKGNPTEIVDALGNRTQMSYDSRGLLTSVTSAVGTPVQNTTSFTYNARGNLLTTTDPKNNVTTLAYDNAGNVIRSTDAEGRVTEFTYDSMNRLTAVLDANLQQTNYVYDEKGNLTQLTDAKNQTTTFTYDQRDRLILSTNPLGLTETFTYDGNGNLASSINRSGQTITFVYDALNRVTSKTRPPASSEAGPQITNFGYDSVGNLTSVMDSDTTVTNVYDLANRLTSTTAASPWMSAKAISYTYDPNGNRLTMTDPQTGGTTYVSDSLNRLISLTNPAGRTVGFAYDALSRRTTLTHANGVTANYTYDAASQLLTLTHQIGAATINSFAYNYDKVGNRKSKTDSNGTANYTYDTLNRLTQAVNPLPTNPLETFNYDPVGNRISSNQNGASTFNSVNQLLDDVNFTYQYDNSGNMTRRTAKVGGAVTQYEYDAENKLVRVVSPANTTNYRYDGLGRRVEKEVIAGTTTITRYVYDNEDILLELDGSNSIVARYTHGPGIDEPLIMEKNNQSFFYHADGLGSITEITDQSGAVVQRYAYSSFGKIESQLNPNFAQPYTYTARELDSETGLYYYRGRYYDPAIGRFLETDPIGIAGGPNSYVYDTNDPINQLDPFGLDPVDVVANIAAGFGDVVSFGLTNRVREIEGWNRVIETCSTGYSVGWWAGMGHQIAFSGIGSFNGGARTVLWSGKGARGWAETAKGTGTLLSDTVGGKFLSILDDYVKLPKPVWNAASEIFAANAKGEVRAFLIDAPTSGTFQTTEVPVLNFMNNVNSFVTGSPATKLIKPPF
ncbi:MAG TPA: tandem-95 repeat protein [Candidatus Binatia bacterium]